MSLDLVMVLLWRPSGRVSREMPANIGEFPGAPPPDPRKVGLRPPGPPTWVPGPRPISKYVPQKMGPQMGPKMGPKWDPNGTPNGTQNGPLGMGHAQTGHGTCPTWHGTCPTWHGTCPTWTRDMPNLAWDMPTVPGVWTCPTKLGPNGPGSKQWARTAQGPNNGPEWPRVQTIGPERPTGLGPGL